MLEKTTKTIGILIDCVTGTVSIRKAIIVTDDGEELSRSENVTGYMPLTRRKSQLLESLSDRPNEQGYFDNLWTPEYLSPFDAAELARNEDQLT